MKILMDGKLLDNNIVKTWQIKMKNIFVKF